MIKLVPALVVVALVLLVTNTKSYASFDKKETTNKCYLTSKFLECTNVKPGDSK